MRIGAGIDAHRFEPGRRLVLGGVEIPDATGLGGHSDADVVLHALMDALLGAGGLGDIGEMFPDDDPAYRDASSLELLGRVMEAVAGRGFRVENADLVVVCEEPRISSLRREMAGRIEGALGVDPGRVGVKGTTTEGMGFPGRGEGIMAFAVVLLSE
ncbi:MAG: 2-C-methyl-D-erythritol 2,4-cyclodiphosphate synthase [Actinomycetota bacterium]